MNCCWPVFALLLLFSVPALADDYRVEKLSEAPPADAISPEIGEQIAPEGLRVVRGEGRTMIDIWPTKQWNVKSDFTASPSVLYPFNSGELMGLARFKNRSSDFRQQEIPAGVYTLRYALQPVDGNHIGTSDTRDFLLLTPADKDQQLDAVPEMQLFQTSATTSGGTHPAMLSLLRVGEDAGSLPKVNEDEARELVSVVFDNAVKADGGSKKQPIEVVIVGHAPE